jgi:hypothetical protein
MLIRMHLLCWRPNWIRSCLRTRLLWFPPRVTSFLTLETHFVMARLWLILPTPLALFSQKATPVPTTTLPLSILRRSLTRSVCLDVPAGLSHSPLPAALPLRIALNFSPQKAGATVGRPSACATAKGASRCRPRCPPRCRRGCDTASDPPPRPRSPHIKSSSRCKLIAPFIEILHLS